MDEEERRRLCLAAPRPQAQMELVTSHSSPQVASMSSEAPPPQQQQDAATDFGMQQRRFHLRKQLIISSPIKRAMAPAADRQSIKSLSSSRLSDSTSSCDELTRDEQRELGRRQKSVAAVAAAAVNYLRVETCASFVRTSSTSALDDAAAAPSSLSNESPAATQPQTRTRCLSATSQRNVAVARGQSAAATARLLLAPRQLAPAASSQERFSFWDSLGGAAAGHFAASSAPLQSQQPFSAARRR